MQTYRRLDKVLKPIPLDTPTEIELEPSKIIQVTLLDANHCSGSVMFRKLTCYFSMSRIDFRSD